MSLMSQVFIGSIFYEVTEGQLRDAFSPYGQIKGIVHESFKARYCTRTHNWNLGFIFEIN